MIFVGQASVHLPHMSAPPAPFPNAGHHGTNHADECDESYDRIEPSDDDIRDDDPIEV